MKHIDEIYKEWCGSDRLENSVKLTHDSTECIEFAEYYYKEMQLSKNIAYEPVLAVVDSLNDDAEYCDEYGQKIDY